MNKRTLLGQYSLLLLFLGLPALLPTASYLHAQEVILSYPEGKITMKDGSVIIGENLEITTNDATLMVNGIKQYFMLENVEKIMAKKGKAKVYAKKSALNCVGCNLFLIILVAEEKSIDDFIGTAIFAGICYGAGYLIGMAMDPWVVVFG